MTVDHWEALFDSTYLRWFDLNKSPALVEITKIEGPLELTLRGGKKVKRSVIHFEMQKGRIKNVKPLVLNRTNGNAIAGIHGPHPSGWIGMQVVLFQDETDLRGERTNCIRIRAKQTKTN